MRCPNCGKTISKKVKFCRYCGENLEEKSEVNNRLEELCLTCKKVRGKDTDFCSNCGNPFPESITRSKSSEVKPEGESIDPRSEQVKSLEQAIITKAKAIKAGSAGLMPKTSDESISKPADVNRSSSPKSAKQPPVKVSKGSKPVRSKSKAGLFLKTILALGIASVLVVQCLPELFLQKPPNSTTAGPSQTGTKPYRENPFPTVSVTAKELAISGEKVMTGPNEPIVSASGVTVDFGQYNLTDSAELEVARLPVKTDEAAGVEFQVYNLTLDGMGAADEFTTLVDVTLPYDPKGIDPDNEATAVSAGWYDEASGRWIILPSTVDVAKHTITFQTAHFSPKAVLINKLNQGTKLFYYENGSYEGPTTKVLVDTGALITEMRKIESNAFGQLIRDKSVPTNEMVDTGLGLTNVLTSGADYGSSLKETLLPALGPVASSLKNKLLVVGTAATFLKVVDQYSRGVDSYKIFRDNVLDSLEILVSGVAVVYGSPLFVMVGAGIWAVGIYDQATYDPDDITTYRNKLEEVYNAFTQSQIIYNLRTADTRWAVASSNQAAPLSSDEIRLNSKAAWALAVKSIYLQSKGEPQKIKDRVDTLVQAVAGQFWSLYRKDAPTLYHWIDQDSGLLSPSAIARLDLSWPTPSDAAETISQLQAREKIRLHDCLQDIYAKMSEFEIDELRRQYLESVLDLADEYNKTMHFELVDENLKEPGFANSALSSKTFYIAAKGNLAQDFKITQRPKDSNEVFTCNVYHYILAGMPTEVHMYPFDGDFAVRDAEFSFEPQIPVTKVSLQGVPQVEVGIIEVAGPRYLSFDGYNNDSGTVKVEFNLYYRDGFPTDSLITFNFGTEDMVYSGTAQYGDHLPDGRWHMVTDYNYYKNGTYHPTFQLVDKDGKVLGEDSISISISGLWDEKDGYITNPWIPEGDTSP